MKISFTTLACPDWSWERVVDTATELGYDGLELRGVDGELELHKANPFLPENLNATKTLLAKRGLEICCLDTSSSFHDPEKYPAAIESAKAQIDLATALGAPFIRVFGDQIPEESQRDAVLDRVTQGLLELGDYAAPRKVMVLLETHGDFSRTDDILTCLTRVKHPAVGVLWDVHHPFRFHGESVSDTLNKLGSDIRHIHLKDSVVTPAGGHRYVLTGEGDVPLRKTVELLRGFGYTGWLSLEWEKKWCPDIEEPEVALPQFITTMRSYLTQGS